VIALVMETLPVYVPAATDTTAPAETAATASWMVEKSQPLAHTVTSPGAAWAGSATALRATAAAVAAMAARRGRRKRVVVMVLTLLGSGRVEGGGAAGRRVTRSVRAPR